MLCILVVGACCATFLAFYESVPNCTLRAPNGGGRFDGVRVPLPACALARLPRCRDIDPAKSRCHAEAPPNYCIFGWNSQSAKVTVP
jgi:hypothetical protein